MKEKICFYAPPFPYVKSYFDMVDVSCEYGLKYIEGFSTFDFETPDIQKAKALREYADSKGIGFSCFSVYANLVGEDSDLMVKRLKEYAEVAKILGSPYLHHTIASQLKNPKEVLSRKSEIFEKGILAVREIYDYCRELGIRAVYEEQGYIFNGISGFKNFLDSVDRDVGVVADFANIYMAGDNVIEFIKAFSDRIVHAHIKDITICCEKREGRWIETLDGNYMLEVPIEYGIVPVKEGIKLLKKSGYKGFFGLEYGAKSDNSKEITQVINLVEEYLKAL